MVAYAMMIEVKRFKVGRIFWDGGESLRCKL